MFLVFLGREVEIHISAGMTLLKPEMYSRTDNDDDAGTCSIKTPAEIASVQIKQRVKFPREGPLESTALHSRIEKQYDCSLVFHLDIDTNMDQPCST